MTYRLLDLFCGAGGATKGYQRAGFYVVGIDNQPQPRYCGDAFYQADALEYCAEHGHEFDAIHASPPCQAYSITKYIHRKSKETHPKLIEQTRNCLRQSYLPYVIENVVGAPLENPVILCGMMFGLQVYRHRLFESSIPIMLPRHSKHVATTGSHRGYSKGYPFICVAGHNFDFAQAKTAMCVDWMTKAEIAQAIPPAYTEFIGKQLIAYLERAK